MGFHFVHHGTGDPLFSRSALYFDAFVHICYKVTTVSQRSVLMGIFGAIFAIASIGGPLLGGLFAGMLPLLHIIQRSHILKDKASWRWVKPLSYLTGIERSRFVCLSRTVGVSVEFIFRLAVYLLHLPPADINLPVRGSKCSLFSKFYDTGLDRWHSTRRGLLSAPLYSRTCGKRDVDNT